MEHKQQQKNLAISIEESTLFDYHQGTTNFSFFQITQIIAMKDTHHSTPTQLFPQMTTATLHASNSWHRLLGRPNQGWQTGRVSRWNPLFKPQLIPDPFLKRSIFQPTSVAGQPNPTRFTQNLTPYFVAKGYKRPKHIENYIIDNQNMYFKRSKHKLSWNKKSTQRPIYQFSATSNRGGPYPISHHKAIDDLYNQPNRVLQNRFHLLLLLLPNWPSWSSLLTFYSFKTLKKNTRQEQIEKYHMRFYFKLYLNISLYNYRSCVHYNCVGYKKCIIMMISLRHCLTKHFISF